MCQAIAAGGRRCPRHRRDSMVAIHLATQESGLSTEAVSALFSDLRRLARHTGIPHEENEYEEFVASLREQVTADDSHERYRSMLEDHRSDDPPAPGTLYALVRLRARAIEASVALDNILGDMAARAGVSQTEASREFEHALASAAAQNDEANRPTAQDHTRAHERGLPTHPTYLTALNAVRNTYSPQEQHRGPSRFGEDTPTVTMGLQQSMVAKYDSDGGSLQVTQTDNGTVTRYRDVPLQLWNELRRAPEDERFSYYTNRILGNRDFQYDSPGEAEDDSYTYRCDLCGQFRARAHRCPERETLTKLVEATPGSTRGTFNQEEVRAVLEQERSLETENRHRFQSGVTQVSGPDALREEKLSLHVSAEESNELLDREFRLLEVMPVTRVKAWLAEGSAEYAPMGQSLTRAQIEALPEHLHLAFGYSDRVDEDGRYYMYAVAPHDPDTHQMLHRSRGLVYIDEDSPLDFRFRKRGKFDGDEGYNVEAVGGEYHLLVEKAATHMKSYRERYGDTITEVGGDLRSRTDISFREGVKATMSWAPPALFKEKVDQGEIVQAPLLWSEGSPEVRVTIDEQGYEIADAEFTVQGEMALRLNSDGTYEVVSPRSALRCDCGRYTTSYHCTHVSYVYRNAPRMGYQLAQKADERPAPLASRVPARLAASSHVEIDESPDESLRAVRFDPEILLDLDSIDNRTEGVRVPREVWLDEQDEVTLARMNNLAQAYITRPTSVLMARALLYTDNVTVPFQISSREDATLAENSFRSSQMIGSLQYYRDENGELATSVKNLYCECVVYQQSLERGDSHPSCPHTKILSDHQRRIFAPVSQGPVARASITDELEANSRLSQTTYHQNVPVYLRMNTEGLTREEAVAAVEAERVRTQRAEEDRLRQEREDERVRREEKASMMDVLYSGFNRDNPDYDTYRESQRELWENVDTPYGDNTEAVHALIAETQSLNRPRRDIIGYRTENVTDGVCDPNIPGSRRFGVELEFMLPNRESRYEALQEIAAELKREGLSDRDSVGGYHSGARSGWSSWSLEEDSTVDGELVSPLMADTPEHWEQLDKVLSILKKHGATTSKKAGSHVHVSSGSFGGKLAKDVEVLRTVRENEDVLFRAAADPTTGSHRGTQWCAPNVSTAAYGEVQPFEYNADENGYEDALDEHMSHESAVNFAESYGMNTKAHIEYRMWDSSLDAATIQQQVAASVAITEASERRVDGNQGVSKERDHIAEDPEKGWGASGKRLGVGTSVVDDISARNVGAFTDRVFRRREDREAFIRLYALSRNN